MIGDLNLNPCPFCESTYISIQHMDKHKVNGYDTRIYQAYCTQCWANRGWCDTKESAIEWWNKRKDGK